MVFNLKLRVKNIFDEIYYEIAGATGDHFEKSTSLSLIRDMEASTISSSVGGHDGKVIIVKEYKREEFKKRNIVFFSIINNNDKKILDINESYFATKELNVDYQSLYDVKKRTLTIITSVYLKKERKTIEDPTKVRKIMKEQHVSKQQLDRWYDEGMNKMFLKDWCFVYPSNYSPQKWGKVKVTIQWADWKLD